ncbi:hypothetical protein [Methyloraptor flagellatus]|uniref:Uncharacterized protein n=1 Tax=Methyloraptor flagellatus TaxID=3162530 RepID=A0AAU7XED5_9HYPH
MRKVSSLAVIALLAVAGATPVSANEKQLSGQEIDRTVRGKRVYLSVPLGGEFPLYYKANGQVDGSGEALGLGRVMAPKDKGRWWVAGNKLCQKWEQWYDGNVFCFQIRQTGPTSIAWVRDDGYSGTARIGQ